MQPKRGDADKAATQHFSRDHIDLGRKNRGVQTPIKPHTFPGRISRDALLASLLLLLAFLARLGAIERLVTPDELTWVYRSYPLFVKLY